MLSEANELFLLLNHETGPITISYCSIIYRMR